MDARLGDVARREFPVQGHHDHGRPLRRGSSSHEVDVIERRAKMVAQRHGTVLRVAIVSAGSRALPSRGVALSRSVLRPRRAATPTGKPASDQPTGSVRIASERTTEDAHTSRTGSGRTHGRLDRSGWGGAAWGDPSCDNRIDAGRGPGQGP